MMKMFVVVLNSICKMNFKKSFFLVVLFMTSCIVSASEIRKTISLNDDWRSVAHDTNKDKYNGFEQSTYPDKDWKKVTVPHNWDKYEGYRRLLHGNRHG